MTNQPKQLQDADELEKKLLDWAATYGVFSLSGVTIDNLIALILQDRERAVRSQRIHDLAEVQVRAIGFQQTFEERINKVLDYVNPELSQLATLKGGK